MELFWAKDYINVDVSRIDFKSIFDGDEFYNASVKFVGFSVYKDDVERDKNNIVTFRTWFVQKKDFEK